MPHRTLDDNRRSATMRGEFTVRRASSDSLFECAFRILRARPSSRFRFTPHYLGSYGGHPHREGGIATIVDQSKPTGEVKYAETNGQWWFAPWTAGVRCGGTFIVPRLEDGGRPLAGQRAIRAHGTGTQDPGDRCAQCTQRPRSRYRARRDRRLRAAAARQAPEYKPSVREAQQEEGLAVPP